MRFRIRWLWWLGPAFWWLMWREAAFNGHKNDGMGPSVVTFLIAATWTACLLMSGAARNRGYGRDGRVVQLRRFGMQPDLVLGHIVIDLKRAVIWAPNWGFPLSLSEIKGTSMRHRAHGATIVTESGVVGRIPNLGDGWYLQIVTHRYDHPIVEQRISGNDNLINQQWAIFSDYVSGRFGPEDIVRVPDIFIEETRKTQRLLSKY